MSAISATRACTRQARVIARTAAFAIPAARAIRCVEVARLGSVAITLSDPDLLFLALAQHLNTSLRVFRYHCRVLVPSCCTHRIHRRPAQPCPTSTRLASSSNTSSNAWHSRCLLASLCPSSIRVDAIRRLCASCRVFSRHALLKTRIVAHPSITLHRHQISIRA